MFTNVQQQLQANKRVSANSRDDVNDENKAQTIIGKEKLAGGQLGDFSYGTRAATKRNALGDVSNIQAKATILQDKTAKTRGAAVLAATRLKALQTVPINNVASKPKVEIKKDSKSKMDIEVDLSHKIDALKHEQEELKKRALASKLKGHDDLDAEDKDDPLMISTYVEEVFSYMRELEIKTLPKPNYMDNQSELKWQMRSLLVDWIIEVHYKLKLLPETLFLAVNITDRFLSSRAVSTAKLQLVAVSALLIASKYEEVVSPSVDNFVVLTDRTYDNQEILKAERYMLHVLDFFLGFPSPMNFLRRASKADNYDIRNRTLSKYLMEVALLDERFLPYPSSQIAASALYLSKRMLQASSFQWNNNLAYYSGYEESELIPVVNLFIDIFSKPIKYEAVFKKYSSKKYMKASLYVSEYAIKHFGLERSEN